ncbi:MAG: hypothetical protein GXO10_06565 [Crenarchaeota archaeon]|nr:hypothetical protein [Thermoproteota archaeon]
MIEIHLSTKIDDILRNMEIPNKIEAKTLEDFIILHRLTKLGIEVYYNPKTELEEKIVRYVGLKHSRKYDPAYKELKKFIRERSTDIIRLMLREVNWKTAYKYVLKGGVKNLDVIHQIWILSRYHLHSLARSILEKILERSLDNYSKLLLLSTLLYSILELEFLDKKFISLKVHDIFYYSRWVMVILDNVFIVTFKSCDRIYTVSPLYVITDQAKITVDSKYVINRLGEHVLLIDSEKYSILICLSSYRERVSVKMRYSNIVVKCEDSDFEDSNDVMEFIVPQESSYVVKGSFEVESLNHL